MSKVNVADGQTLWDIALQEYGSVEGVFILMAENPFVGNINQELEPGIQLNVKSEPIAKDVKSYYQRNRVHPTSGSNLEIIDFDREDFDPEDFS